MATPMETMAQSTGEKEAAAYEKKGYRGKLDDVLIVWVNIAHKFLPEQLVKDLEDPEIFKELIKDMVFIPYSEEEPAKDNSPLAARVAAAKKAVGQ